MGVVLWAELPVRRLVGLVGGDVIVVIRSREVAA